MGKRVLGEGALGEWTPGFGGGQLKPPHLILWPDRVELVMAKMMKSERTTIHFDQMARVDQQTRGALHTIIIESSGGAVIECVGLKKADALEAVTRIHETAAAYKQGAGMNLAAPPPPGGDNVASQLAQLAALHAQGALSDEEFSAGKARLLGG